MKKFIFILHITVALLIAHSLPLFAQLPTQEWVARIPGPSNDFTGPFLAVDKNGNSYVAGTRVINDTINILCAKYNTSGSQQWISFYKYPGYGYFTPWGIGIDSSGNAYVIADYSINSVLPYNALIVKFNSSNGSPVWAKTYNGQYGWGAFRDIKIDRMDNINVVGWTDSSHLVIRYNTNGDSLWSRKYRPPWLVREVTRGCTLDDSLNIIFTGQRRFFYPPYGWYDSLLIAKYSSSGILRWESVYTYNLLGSDLGLKITADQNGNSYIGGITTISGDPVYLTLKYDRNGTRLWYKIYDAPGSGGNTLNDISLDRINSALYVTGAAVTNGVQMATTIKCNLITGDSIWVRNDTGTSKYGDARAIKIDSLGNSYIAGVTSNIGGVTVDLLTIKYSQTGVRNWLMTYNGPLMD